MTGLLGYMDCAPLAPRGAGGALLSMRLFDSIARVMLAVLDLDPVLGSATRQATYLVAAASISVLYRWSSRVFSRSAISLACYLTHEPTPILRWTLHLRRRENSSPVIPHLHEHLLHVGSFNLPE